MDKRELFRQLPKVDNLLEEQPIKELLKVEPRLLVVEGLRAYLDLLRNGIKDGSLETLPKGKELLDGALASISKVISIGDTPVVNASGVFFNPKTGRSILAAPLRADVAQACSSLLQRLVGAEHTLFLNNGTSALLLALSALSRGKEVVVPSSHMVRIGDFDLAETIEAAGARLVEIGCTNRVHLKDYAKALNEQTGAILFVHRPNVDTVGFIKDPKVSELSELAQEAKIPLIVDEGIGSLVDLREFGQKRNPLLREFVESKANIVTFSTDKLIGGPQGGLLISDECYADFLANHPLVRSLPMDVHRLVGLAKTLKLFLEPSTLAEKHPFYKQLALSPKDVAQRAKDFAATIEKEFSPQLEVTCDSGLSSSMSPISRYLMLDTTLVSVKTKGTIDFASFSQALSQLVEIADKDDSKLIIDFRTVAQEDEMALKRAIKTALQYNSLKRGGE